MGNARMVLANFLDGSILYRRADLRICPFSTGRLDALFAGLWLSLLPCNWFPRTTCNWWVDRILVGHVARFKGPSLRPLPSNFRNRGLLLLALRGRGLDRTLRSNLFDQMMNMNFMDIKRNLIAGLISKEVTEDGAIGKI